MRRSPWPWAIVAFFAVVVGINLFLFHLARSTRSGSMETESPYAVSQEYQKDIDAVARFRARGARVTYTKKRSHGEFRIEGLKPTRVLLRALRTQEKGDDAQLELAPEGSDRYRLPKPLGPGGWFLRLEIFEGETRFLWKSTETFPG